MKKAREAETGAAIPISELERWLAAPRIEFDESIAKSPDFLLKWWKEHKVEWPLLAAAARDLLSVSGSEVDVERLFSGCRDEFGIRRHALKADTTTFRASWKMARILLNLFLPPRLPPNPLPPNLLHPKPISLRYQPPV
ncbi:hypothetical protein HRG_012198 [Hirsutella rhossiliensis]